MIVGLTGGIGTGKSTVVSILKSKGIAVVETDMIAREVIQYENIIDKILNNVDKDVLDEDGKIDRKKLAKVVFSDPNKLKILNGITHPLILKEMWKKAREYKRGNRIIFLDIPLLFEIKLEKEMDEIVLVCSTKEMQLKRVMERDKRTKKEALEIINSQMPLYMKRKNSDYVIQNNGSIDELNKKVEDVLFKISN